MSLRGLAFAIILFFLSAPASAQLCSVSEAHLSKLQQQFDAMEALANKNSPPPCGVGGILFNFDRGWRSPAVCGPDDVRQTCVDDVEGAITQNLPAQGFDTGTCDTQKQMRNDLNNRGQDMKNVNRACEQKFITRKASCKDLFRKTIAQVAKCNASEIKEAKAMILSTARKGLKLYCDIIDTHVRGLGTEAKIEATSEQISGRTIANCNNKKSK